MSQHPDYITENKLKQPMPFLCPEQVDTMRLEMEAQELDWAMSVGVTDWGSGSQSSQSSLGSDFDISILTSLTWCRHDITKFFSNQPYSYF